MDPGSPPLPKPSVNDADREKDARDGATSGQHLEPNTKEWSKYRVGIQQFNGDLLEYHITYKPTKPKEKETAGDSAEHDANPRTAAKETTGTSGMCLDCWGLINHLQKRLPRRERKWKSIPQLLLKSAYLECALCTLVASAPATFLDRVGLADENPLKPLREYERLFAASGSLATNTKPIQAFGHLNVVERICEVSFTFEFQGRLAEVLLAVWLEPLPEMKFDPWRRFHNPQPERCEGVRTGSDITWREPLRKNQSWRTFELFQSWISTSLLDHPKCSRALSGETIVNPWREDGLGRTNLPSRVLDVFGEGDVIKLVETRSLGGQTRGSYVTLSHCWGPPDKRPVSTTRANLQQHITAGIQLSSLPKTFRDAVHIVRQLEIPYIWIDSLCIVQDDEADWLAESEKMGEIYHYAALTIAASDAEDSTQGCFIADRRSPWRHSAMTVKYGLGSSNGGNFFKICFSHIPTSRASEPYLSPLGRRAWACQEWYLSRRVIFCTKAGFAWKCCSVQHNERGRYVDMHEQSEWEHLMERYSVSHLTFETDRLVALRGIANLLGKTKERKGQGYHFGHWIGGHDSAIMLCWMMREDQSRRDVDKGPPGVPSWSWASVSGAKAFWRTQYQFFHPCRNLFGADDMSIDPSDGTTLAIRGASLRRVQLSLLTDAELKCHPSLMDRQVWSPEALFIRSRRAISEDTPVHLILGDDPEHLTDTPKQAVGLAALDGDDAPGTHDKEIYVVPMVESPRFAFDPFLPEGLDRMWHGEDVGSQQKLVFKDIEAHRSGEEKCWYSADEIAGRPVTRYSLMAQAGDGVRKPIGSYTSSPPHQAKRGCTADAQYMYVYDGQGKSIFWAILVKPVYNSIRTESGSFRRVGMALLGHERWIGKAKQQDMMLI